MQEEQAENITEPQEAAPVRESKREVSTIGFPYGDLDDAVGLTKAVHAVGGQGCEWEQLAGYLKVAASGGAFRARLAYARTYGLLDYGQGSISLTQLGLRAADPSQEDAARIDSFLTVPLYRKVYEKYKGYTLPPPAALEREMGGMGVSSKQTDKARQVFERSARQAGFFWAGTDRLTLPVIKGRPETRPIEQPAPEERRHQNGGGGGGDDLHPFIQGLLKTLPPPETAWPVTAQAKWLQTAASIFGLIYQADGQIDIKTREPNEQAAAGKPQAAAQSH